jgi:hypothetical protein
VYVARAATTVIGDTTLGVIHRDRLPDVLAVIHRSGYGPMARVFDPARGPVAAQLERAGFPAPPECAASGQELVVLGVTAPGKAARIGVALMDAGAVAVYVTTRGKTSGPLSPVGVEQAAPAPQA